MSDIMDGQLEFFTGGMASMLGPMGSLNEPFEHRWYFSLVPPPLEAQNIEVAAGQLARRFGARDPIRCHRLHVSLNGVWRSKAAIEPALIQDALEVGAAIRRPGFDIMFDVVKSFSGAARSRTGGRSIVPTVLTCSTGARELQALYSDLRREMQRLGMPVGPKTIEPHLTIWYGPQRVSDLTLPRPFRWAVRKFWLVHTTRGQRQPDYVGEWSLG